MSESHESNPRELQYSYTKEEIDNMNVKLQWFFIIITFGMYLLLMSNRNWMLILHKSAYRDKIYNALYSKSTSIDV